MFINARCLDVHQLVFSEGGSLSSSPWAHYENDRHTLDYIILAISLLQGIKIPSSSSSHSTPAWINFNFSEKNKCSQKHFPLTWDSAFFRRPTGKAISSSAVRETPSSHNYQTTSYLGWWRSLVENQQKHKFISDLQDLSDRTHTNKALPPHPADKNRQQKLFAKQFAMQIKKNCWRTIFLGRLKLLWTSELRCRWKEGTPIVVLLLVRNGQRNISLKKSQEFLGLLKMQ